MTIALQHLAHNLRTGDLSSVESSREVFEHSADDIARLELMEIAKQSIIYHLKLGDAQTARKIATLFDIPGNMFEDTIVQAILSSFREGDTETVRRLKGMVPLSARLEAEIVAYCCTWSGSACEEMRTVLA